MSPLSARSYFFDSGLRFACHRCGTCCTGAPGIIRVAADEVDRIAAYLTIPRQRFQRDFIVQTQTGPSIGEHADGCCFLYEQGCRVYPVRPRQCRAYPFWFNILRAERRWLREAQQCPGIGQGRLHTREDILLRVAQDMPGPPGDKPL